MYRLLGEGKCSLIYRSEYKGTSACKELDAIHFELLNNNNIGAANIFWDSGILMWLLYATVKYKCRGTSFFFFPSI